MMVAIIGYYSCRRIRSLTVQMNFDCVFTIELVSVLLFFFLFELGEYFFLQKKGMWHIMSSRLVDACL